VLPARARERRILGEEAVAGMNRVGAGLLRSVQDPLLVQVALGGRPAADQVRLVRIADVRGIAVDLRIDGDRPDT
jgi:hypothetical protein